MIISMNTLTKMFVAMLLMGAIFATAQAGTVLSIGATVTSKFELNVLAASRDWGLDPDIPTFTDALVKDSGISVKANKAGWTVSVQADKAKLTKYVGTSYDDAVNLKSAMQLQATPVDGGSGQTVTMSTGQQPLWNGATPKGSAVKAGLIFTQPVSYDDEPLTTGNYRSVLTFTLAPP
jgi:hypothetical protein